MGLSPLVIRNTITFGVSPVPRGSRLSNLHTVIPESSRRTRPRGHAEPTVHCPGSPHRHGPRCRRGNSAAFEKQHQRGGRCELSSVLKQSGPWGPTLSREASISQGSRVGLLGSSSAGLVAEELPYYYHPPRLRGSPAQGSAGHCLQRRPLPSRHPPPPGRLAPDPAGLCHRPSFSDPRP